MSTEILVLGARGQLGCAALRRLGGAASGLARAELDITDAAAVAAALDARQPAVVLNCAAATHVDKCEFNPDAAFAANETGPRILARACAANGVALVHVSTDYVFDGALRRPYGEGDQPNPLNAYGRSKLAGERAVLEAGGRAAVIRCSWVFHGAANAFVSAVMIRGRALGRLSMVADQINCPTPAGALAEAMAVVGRRLARGEGPGGIYHFCGAPATSRLDWARAILDLAGLAHVELDPMTSDSFSAPAHRPLYSVLDCALIARDHGIAQPNWRSRLASDLAMGVKEGE